MVYGREPSINNIERIWKIFLARNCKKILDAGCGIGWFGEYKPNDDVVVYGIDNDKEAIRIAKKYEIATLGDVRRLPYPDQFFDGVLAFHIIEHVAEDLEVMMEFYRVLKKGGILVASSPTPWCDVYKDPTHVRSYTTDSFSNLARSAGFDVVECFYLGRGIPGFGKLKLHSLSYRIGNFLANRLHVFRGHVFTICIAGNELDKGYLGGTV